MPLSPACIDQLTMLFSCLSSLPPLPAQGDYFTVEDLAFDYPTLNTL